MTFYGANGIVRILAGPVNGLKRSARSNSSPDGTRRRRAGAQG